MKITINNEGTLINADNKKTLNHPKHPTLPNVNWDKNPHKLSQEISQGLNLVEAHNKLTNKVNIVRRVLESIEDTVYTEKANNELNEISVAIEDIDPVETSDMIFRNGEEPYELEVSDLAAKYVARSSMATRVATTNILTGVHIGNTPDKEYTVLIEEVVNEISEQLDDLHEDVEDKYYFENPEEYDSLEDDDDYDDEDDEWWDDED